MAKKIKNLAGVFVLALISIILLPSSSASAEELELQTFRNVVTGVNTNIATTNLNIQQRTGWQSIDGIWYYYKNDGIKATGWLKDNNTWYYLDGTGIMLHNTNIDGYYLSNSGALIM